MSKVYEDDAIRDPSISEQEEIGKMGGGYWSI